MQAERVSQVGGKSRCDAAAVSWQSRILQGWTDPSRLKGQCGIFSIQDFRTTHLAGYRDYRRMDMLFCKVTYKINRVQSPGVDYRRGTINWHQIEWFTYPVGLISLVQYFLDSIWKREATEIEGWYYKIAAADDWKNSLSGTLRTGRRDEPKWMTLNGNPARKDSSSFCDSWSAAVR